MYWNNATDKKTGYVFINNNLSVSELDCKYLFDFVKKGNTVFMAANSFSGMILILLKLKPNMAYDLFNDTAKN